MMAHRRFDDTWIGRCVPLQASIAGLRRVHFDHTFFRVVYGVGVATLVVFMVMLLFPPSLTPGAKVLALPASNQEESQDSRGVQDYRIRDLELKNKSLDDKVNEIVIGNRKMELAVNTLVANHDNDHWWVQLLCVIGGLIIAWMAIPHVKGRLAK